MKTYKEEKKFIHLEFLYAHEATGEMINQLDAPLSKFLEDIEGQGLLEDTVVILFSDHGYHIWTFYKILNMGNFFIEINLPTLMINIPAKMN